jgi:tetratricopeptide (TPR) repeat protein
MRIVLTLFVLGLSSCSFIKSGQQEISINSNPAEAEVGYLTANGDFRSLGKTPLKLDQQQLSTLKKEDKQFSSFQIKKSGHAVENLLVDVRTNNKIDYFANLKPIDAWNDKELEVSSTSANRLAQKIQMINQMVLKKEHDKALLQIDFLIQQFPKANTFYDMKGSVLLLMGKKTEATASYQKSLALNPDNVQAQRVLSKIKVGVQ